MQISLYFKNHKVEVSRLERDTLAKLLRTLRATGCYKESGVHEAGKLVYPHYFEAPESIDSDVYKFLQAEGYELSSVHYSEDYTETRG
jgi:hypothetical protein